MAIEFRRGISEFIHDVLNLDKDAYRKIKGCFLFFFPGAASITTMVPAVSLRS